MDRTRSWLPMLLLWVAACASGTQPPPDASAPVEAVAEALSPDVDEGLPDLTGRVYRIHHLWATAPTDAINEAWAYMVADGSLVLLVRVVAHDTATGSLTLDIGSGWAEREESAEGLPTPLAYRFGLEPVRVTAALSGTTFTMDGLFTVELFPESVNKPFRVVEASGAGTFNEAGTGLEELSLDGLLVEAEVTDFCLGIPGLGTVNFHWFMNLIKVCPDADSDGDGVADAYHFVGGVAGEETALFQPGIHPIDPLISTCEPHLEPCLSR
jgi:hypothetical protein